MKNNKDKINIELELGDINNIIDKLKEDRATDKAVFILTLACSVICLLASLYFNLTDAPFIRNILLAIFGIGTVASCFVAFENKKYDEIIQNYELRESKLLDELKNIKDNELQLKEEKTEEESKTISFTNNLDNAIQYYNNEFEEVVNELNASTRKGRVR